MEGGGGGNMPHSATTIVDINAVATSGGGARAGSGGEEAFLLPHHPQHQQQSFSQEPATVTDAEAARQRSQPSAPPPPGKERGHRQETRTAGAHVHMDDDNGKRLRESPSCGASLLALLCQRASLAEVRRELARHVSRCRMRVAGFVANLRYSVFSSSMDPRLSGDRSTKHGGERGSKPKGRSRRREKQQDAVAQATRSARQARLCAMVSVLILLLLILGLLAILLTLLIFGPQMYEDRMRLLRAPVADDPSAAALQKENYLVAKMFNAFGVGLGGEHERRLKLQAAMDKAESLQRRNRTLSEKLSDTMGDPVGWPVRGKQGDGAAADVMNEQVLKGLLKLDLGQIQQHHQQQQQQQPQQKKTDLSLEDERRAKKRREQLEELAAWLAVIQGATKTKATRMEEKAFPRGDDARVGVPELRREQQQQQRVAAVAAVDDDAGGVGELAHGAGNDVSLPHFTLFYQKLKEHYDDSTIAQLLDTLAVGGGAKANRGRHSSRKGKSSSSSSRHGSEEAEDCDAEEEVAARQRLLGFARATGRTMQEHKRLRPFDEIELLKYRHRFIEEEFNSEFGFRGGGGDDGGLVGKTEGRQEGEEDANAAVLSVPKRLARVIQNQRVKQALYATAPSVLNRNYYFPTQRFELFAPYASDTVRSVDAWFTPVAVELLYYLGAAGDGGAVPPMHSALSSPPDNPAAGSTVLPKNAYLATRDPLLPLSLLQHELKFLSAHQQSAIGVYLAPSSQKRRFLNKENMLENVGNLVPLFTSLHASGATASRNNLHLTRLIRRLQTVGSGGDGDGGSGAGRVEYRGRQVTAQQAVLLRKLDRFLFDKKRMSYDERTIFVSMASFRDAECAPTLYDMYKKAKNPFRVFAGIAEQNRQGDPSCLADLLLFPPLPCYAPESHFARQTNWEGGAEEAAMTMSQAKLHGEQQRKEGGGLAAFLGFGRRDRQQNGGDEAKQAASDAANVVATTTATELLSHLLADSAKTWQLTAKQRGILQAEHGDHFEFLAQQRAYSLDSGFPTNLAEYTTSPASAFSSVGGGHGATATTALTFASPPGKLHHFRSFYSSDPVAAPMTDADGLSVMPKVGPTDFTQRLCFPAENVRVRRIRADKAFGPTFGRYMAMLLYRGESMVFIIDSHNRFTPMWDTLGLHLFLKFNDEKVGLSHYPEGYAHMDNNPNTKRVAAINAQRAEKHHLPPLDMDDEEEELQVGAPLIKGTSAYLCKTFFLENFGYLRLNGIVVGSPGPFHTVNHFLAPYYYPSWEMELVKSHSPSPAEEVQRTNFRMPQPWIAGGFLFTSYHQMREVPFDPHLPHIFDGEEVLFGMRLWTHGFTLFSPEQNLCYHFYTRAKAPKVWSEARSWHSVQGLSRRRIQYFLRSHKKNDISLLVELHNAGYRVDRATYAQQEAPFSPQEATVLVDADRYGMGQMRGVQDWYTFAGVDPVSYKIEGRFCGLNDR